MDVTSLTTRESTNTPLQTLARRLVGELFVLLRCGYMHLQNNQALLQPLQRLGATVHALHGTLEADRFRLRVTTRTFFLDDTLIRIDRDTYQASEFLSILCGDLEFGGWEFRRDCGEADLRSMMVAVLEIVKQGSEAVASLRREFGAMQLLPPVELGIDDPMDEREPLALRTYVQGLQFLEERLRAAPGEATGGLPAYKRLAQRLHDAEQEHAALLLALPLLTLRTGRPEAHALNVTVYLAGLAGTMKLPRDEVVQLLLAGLFHAEREPGQTPGVISGKQSADPRTVYQHLLPLLRHASTEKALTRALLVFEHDLLQGTVGCTDYPQDLDSRSQLLAVADAFVALQEGLGAAPCPPDQALRQLVLESGGRHPVWALEALCRTVGRIPIGTVVRLGSGGIALVVDRPAEEDEAPPLVLIHDAAGRAPARRTLIGPKAGTNERILHALDPLSVGINPLAWFFEDAADQ